MAIDVTMAMEFLIMGSNALLFGLFYKLYSDSKRAFGAIKAAQVFEINQELTEAIQESPDHMIPYVVVKGTVVAVNQTLRSQNNPAITGVVQQIILKEHQVKWSWAARWWIGVERELSRAMNCVPFYLNGKGENAPSVLVLESRDARLLDLTTISDRFERSGSGLSEAIWGYVTGERTRGYQEVERMLTEGTLLTRAGCLSLVKLSDGNESLLLQPPDSGLHYILTQMPRQAFLKDLEWEMRILQIVTIVLGLSSIYFVTRLVRKFYDRLKRSREQADQRRRLQELRRERGRRTPSNVTPQQQLPSENADTMAAELQLVDETALMLNNPCVVCLNNPREVVIVECGHICCCADCAEALSPQKCPICRQDIVRFLPAYMV